MLAAGLLVTGHWLLFYHDALDRQLLKVLEGDLDGADEGFHLELRKIHGALERVIVGPSPDLTLCAFASSTLITAVRA